MQSVPLLVRFVAFVTDTFHQRFKICLQEVRHSNRFSETSRVRFFQRFPGLFHSPFAVTRREPAAPFEKPARSRKQALINTSHIPLRSRDTHTHTNQPAHTIYIATAEQRNTTQHNVEATKRHGTLDPPDRRTCTGCGLRSSPPSQHLAAED